MMGYRRKPKNIRKIGR